MLIHTPMAGMLMVMVWMICVGSDAVEEFTPGVVTIDALTFTRVVNGRKPVLVRFARRYTDPSQDFASLALKAADHPSGLLLADMTIFLNDPYVEHPSVARYASSPAARMLLSAWLLLRCCCC